MVQGLSNNCSLSSESEILKHLQMDYNAMKMSYHVRPT